MFSRFLTNVTMLLLAGFLAVACFAFGLSTVVWLAFGVGCAVAVVALADFALPERGAVQRTVDLFAALLAAWLIVAALTYASAVVVKWIAFGEAGLLLVLALLGLVTHELLVLRRAAPVAMHNGDGHAHSGLRREPDPGARAAGRQ